MMLVSLIFGVATFCGSAQAFIHPGIPQEVEFISFGIGTGTISFAGGDSPLVGKDLHFEGIVNYWAFDYRAGMITDILITDSFGTDVTLDFETGPRIGPGYDFSGGGFILGGVFGNVHVDSGGLRADFQGSLGSIRTRFPLTPIDGFGPGILRIGFEGVGIAPEPFTITEISTAYIDVVPLPASVLLLGSGLFGLAGLSWRRMRQS